MLALVLIIFLVLLRPSLSLHQSCSAQCEFVSNPPVTGDAFEVMSSVTTELLLRDENNRILVATKAQVEAAVKEYFKSHDFRTKDFNRCSGAVHKYTCDQNGALLLTDPRSTVGVTYNRGEAHIMDGTSTGGVIAVTVDMSFVVHALIAVSAQWCMNVGGDCDKYQVLTCPAQANQFIDFSGRIVINANIQFQILPQGVQTSLLVTSAQLLPWTHSDIPKRCLDVNGYLNNFFQKFFKEFLYDGSTNAALNERISTRLQQQGGQYTDMLFVPGKFNWAINKFQNVSGSLIVSSLTWKKGDSIVVSIEANDIQVIETQTGRLTPFRLTDRDRAAPPLSTDWPPLSSRLGSWRVSLTTVHSILWIAREYLLDHAKTGPPIGVDDTLIYISVLLGDTPVVTIPRDGVIEGNLPNASRVLGTCAAKDGSGNATFLDFDVSNISFNFTIVFDQSIHKWYLQVLDINANNTVFELRVPILPTSASFLIQLARILVVRSMPDLNDELKDELVPLPEGVAPILAVFTTLIKQQSGDYGFVEFNAESERRWSENSGSREERAATVIRRGSAVAYTGSFLSGNGACVLSQAGDSVGFDRLMEEGVCVQSQYAGFMQLVSPSEVNVDCNSSSCVDGCTSVKTDMVCVQSTAAWPELSKFTPENCVRQYVEVGDDTFVLVRRDCACFATYSTYVEALHIGNARNISLNLYSHSFIFDRTTSGSFLVTPCEARDFSACGLPLNLSLGTCVDFMDWSFTIFPVVEAPNCEDPGIIPSFLVVVIVLSIFVASSVIVGIIFACRRSSRLDHSFSALGIAFLVAVLLFVAWSTFFPLGSLEAELEGSAVLNDYARDQLAQWRFACLVTFMVIGSVIVSGFFLAFGFNGKIELVETGAFAPFTQGVIIMLPVVAQTMLLLLPGLLGRPTFSTMANVAGAANQSDIMDLIRHWYYGKMVVIIPLVRLTALYLSVFDGLLTGLNVWRWKEPGLASQLIAKFSSIIGLLMLLPLLIFYQGSSLPTWVLPLYVLKWFVPLVLHFVELRFINENQMGKKFFLSQAIRCGTILCLSALILWQLVLLWPTAPDVPAHYALCFVATAFATLLVARLVPHDMSAIVSDAHDGETLRAMSEEIDPNHAVHTTGSLNEDEGQEAIQAQHLRSHGEAHQETVARFSWPHAVLFGVISLCIGAFLGALIFTRAVGAIVVGGIVGAILGSVIQIFVFRFKDQFDFVLDLHRYNNRLLPRLRMKMRRLFLIGGILALAGIIALDVFVFVTKEANPNLMIKSLLASYGIDIEFSADASLLDKAGEVFFVVSVISIVCNCLALFAFTAAVVVDTGSERDRRIKYSRSLVIAGFLLIMIGFCLNLIPNYTDFIPINKIFPNECGPMFSLHLRHMLEKMIDSLFAFVVVVKLGFVATAVPLSLIHASEELQEHSPLMYHLGVTFALFGPVILAFPMLIFVQISYAVFEPLSEAVTPLVVAFVLAPSLCFAAAIVVMKRFRPRSSTMLFYYLFSIISHFVLQFFLALAILGLERVLQAIFSLEFIVVFAADFFLIIVILSDAILSAISVKSNDNNNNNSYIRIDRTATATGKATTNTSISREDLDK